MYLPFLGRWEVQSVDMRHGSGYFIGCGRHYSRSKAFDRASYLQNVTGIRHRVIDLKMFR